MPLIRLPNSRVGELGYSTYIPTGSPSYVELVRHQIKQLSEFSQDGRVGATLVCTVQCSWNSSYVVVCMSVV